MCSESNGSSTFTDFSKAFDPNPGNANPVTLTAKWKANCTVNCTELDLSVNESMGYDYTGKVVGVTLKKAGYYKLEVWGAQGGYGYVSTTAGLGGYAVGSFLANDGIVVYIVVGSKGLNSYNSTLGSDINCTQKIAGGYNGGGSACASITKINKVSGGSGGGATHIAKKAGLLSELSSYKSSVLIVAGGGGGTGYSDDSVNGGGNGGGYIGGAGIRRGSDSYNSGTGGTQSNGGVYTSYNNGCNCCGIESTDGSFGLGSNNYFSGGSCEAASGGGGWYGGAAGNVYGNAGGGGSGYIGNSLLLSAKGITKHMYMYSEGCSSSTAADTKTTCTSSTDHAVSNAANTGNGYAKITYLGT